MTEEGGMGEERHLEMGGGMSGRKGEWGEEWWRKEEWESKEEWGRKEEWWRKGIGEWVEE